MLCDVGVGVCMHMCVDGMCMLCGVYTRVCACGGVQVLGELSPHALGGRQGEGAGCVVLAPPWDRPPSGLSWLLGGAPGSVGSSGAHEKQE